MNIINMVIAVDELPDYNEKGACPTEKLYYLEIVATVDVHSREIYAVVIYDRAYKADLSMNALTKADQEVVNSRILDFITNNIDFLMDSLKEQKQDNDIDHYRDGRLK